MILFCSNSFGQKYIEISSGWKMISATTCMDTGSLVSLPAFNTANWYKIKSLPRTIVAVLQDNGVYPDLFVGKNLSAVPELYKQDWWYRKDFILPPGTNQFWLKFAGISYRAELWINGQLVADNMTMVGQYSAFEFNITRFVKTGNNTLSLKIRPDQTDAGRLELGENWVDWIAASKVPDRNGGIWQPVYLKSTGPVEIKNPLVNTDLPLPDTTKAILRVFCDLVNGANTTQNGTLKGTISRAGKQDISFQKKITIEAYQTKEVSFSPEEYKQLAVTNPDLWWPYTLGKPSLYKLKLEYKTDKTVSDSCSINFGIREVERGRDSANENYMYLKINGFNYLVRGGCYTPDLFFRQDSAQDRAMVRYIKDMGINFIRWESKMGNPYFYDLCDREGIPVMVGWVCCGQWEDWANWNSEAHKVAHQGVASQVLSVRYRASAFMWAHGSDGRPPDTVLNDYKNVLKQLHWQNADVAHCAENTDGIHMMGPYTTKAPYYWFSSAFSANKGFCAEQGDNEVVVPYETLKKFIPAEHLWPIDDYWSFHAGNNGSNSKLLDIQKFITEGFGPCNSAKEFCDLAQIFHYTNTRAQFEAFAARGWATHKGTIYWMLGTHWPSFFGHIVNYYDKPGGSYFGAKKGLQPLNVVYNYYADGDRSKAKIFVYNQTLKTYKNYKVRIRYINLDNTVMFDSKDIAIESIDPLSTQTALTIDRIKGLSSTWFIKCELKDTEGKIILNNIYWQSTTDDTNEGEYMFKTEQSSWGNYKALNDLPKVSLASSVSYEGSGNTKTAKITLTNNSGTIAFFTRVEIIKGNDGEEVVPITYTDNYITLFPGESKIITGTFIISDLSGQVPYIRIEGFNVLKLILK
jgi:exo-1,4-beta-D-glucosaminidase